MSVTNVKNVDEWTKYTVLGYIRRLQHLLNTNIPNDVINVCILYYFVSEYFEKCGQNTIASSKINKNDYICMNHSGGWNTSYGSIIIDGNKSIHSVYRWTFQIYNHAQGGTLIGISNSQFSKINTDMTGSKKASDCYYAFFPKLGTKCSHEYMSDEYGMACYSNCIKVVMILNCKKKKLKYYVDGKYQGVAFRNINFEYKYRLAISISGLLKSVQIIDFHVKNK
eukprot:374135_1